MKKMIALAVTVILLFLASGCKNGAELNVPQGGETAPTITQEADAGTVTYIIDENTCFAGNCETAWFDGYETGDTPYEWLARAYSNREDNPMAILGVFEVIADEATYHIDEMCGCYWWD